MLSSSMPNEGKAVKSGVSLTVPADYCFQLDKNPGVETLVLVITERKEDVDRLRTTLRRGAGTQAGVVPVVGAGAGPAELNAARDMVESWQQLGSRDMVIQKVFKPEVAGEHPYSVHAVRSAPSDANPLVLEIKIRHE